MKMNSWMVRWQTLAWLAIFFMSLHCLPASALQQSTTESTILRPILDQSQPKSILTLDDQDEMASARQVKIIAEVYQLAKKSKTAKELTTLIDQCRDHLNQKFSKDNLDYLTSVVAWGLHKRGEKRMELASDLRVAGNEAQSNAILEKAIEDFDQSVATDSDRWRAILARGMANVFRNEFEKAIEDFTTVVNDHPTCTSAWFNRAEVQYALEKHELAIADYDQVLKLDAKDIQALTGRAHANLRLGHEDQALADYSKVIELGPDNPMARINRGDLYQSMSDWKSAHEDFLAAVDLNGGGIAFQRTAWLLATCPEGEFSRPNDSLDMITKAISLDGQSVTNLETLAAAYAAIGEFEKARNAQTQALDAANSTSDEMQIRMAKYEEGKPYIQPGPDTKIR